MKIFTLALALIATTAHAQDYPAKPIRLVVPYSPGGPVDIVGRLTAQKLTDELKQQVIVDNRAGGGGNIAVEIVAKSVPDGYTLLMGANGTNAINPNLYPNLSVKPARDLAPIGMVASSPMILVIHPSVPATSIKDLIALAKAKPGAINFASSGNGSTAHLSSELFKSMAGVNMVHVPYKGAGAAITALMAGEVQVMFVTPTLGLPQIKAGKIRALGYDAPARAPFLPDVPTLTEAGVPPTQIDASWHGMFAPAKMPRDVLAKLEREVRAAIANPAVRERLVKLGLNPVGDSSAEFTPFVATAVKRMAEAARIAGIEPE